MDFKKQPIYQKFSFKSLLNFKNWFKPKTPGEKPGLKQILLWIGLGLFGLFLFGMLSIGILIAVVSIGLPDVHDLDKLSVSESTTIYDREGNVLYVKHGGENRQYVTYDQIAPTLIDATIAIEDDKYWEHSGFNPIGILRSVLNNVTNLSAQQGGSTITQQYIKNTFLSSEKSITRKLKELILAVQLEQTFDKKKILELYLNKIPYGNNAYGVEKAAQIYFNKHAKDLDLAEGAILASIPKAPSTYNPLTGTKYSKLLTTNITRQIFVESDLKEEEFKRGLLGKTIHIGTNDVYVQGRIDLVLRRMEKLGYISGTQMASALDKAQKIEFKEYHETIKAPHFVFYILDKLEQKYGKEIVEQGGLKVYTTIDPKMQEAAERIVKEGAEANEKKYNAKNAALVSMDPKNGQIMAMVGSRDYWDPLDGNENVALNYRQPGSSFKPFIYAAAFYRGFAPASVVFDTQTKLGSNTYPKNFDGKFRGPMTMREALAQSRNIPAIKAYFLGGEQKEILSLVERMGITMDPNTDPNTDYNWPLSLGAAEVRLIDMVEAFSVFANGGTRYDPVSILKVETSQGELLEEWKEGAGAPALDPQIAFLINSILSDKGVRLAETLTIANQINAAKTGTSNRVYNENGVDKYYPHDLWTMGYTTRLVTGVWTGNNVDKRDGKISTAADGVNVAAPIWKKYMTEVLKGKPAEEFPIPEGITQKTVAKASGKIPGPNTPPDQVVTDYFTSFGVPTEEDNSYIQVDVDTFCGKLANEFTPPEMVKPMKFLNLHDIADYPEWEKGAQDWLKDHAGDFVTGAVDVVMGAAPTESCPGRDLANSNNKPTVTLISPSGNTTVNPGQNLTVQINAQGSHGIQKVEYYLDGSMHYRASEAPFTGTIRVPKTASAGRMFNVEIKAFDQFGFVGTTTLMLTTSGEAVQNSGSGSENNGNGNGGGNNGNNGNSLSFQTNDNFANTQLQILANP